MLGGVNRFRQILDAASVRELDAALIEVYAEFGRLRERYPAAKRIARPGIPSNLSESLVAHASPTLFGQRARGRYGGSDADLLVSRPGGEDLLVEVKASGLHGWQEIKDRDLARDCFVWVAFGPRYVDGSGPIDAHLLLEPSRYTPPRRKLTLPVFLQGASQLEGFETFRFSGVDQMLEGADPSLFDAAPKSAAQPAPESLDLKTES